jgi:NAD(P)-dependent dehydrogenase (short-subunit alcohol dehydrogenase family)
MRFMGKVAIVTGAGSGIGRGIAECLAEEGCFVLVNDVREHAAKETCQILADTGYRAAVAIADISTLGGAETIVDGAVRHGGRLDLLVNCAGRQVVRQMDDLQPEEWDLILDVNLKGYYLCAKAAVPLLATYRGAIVNIGSVHARATLEGFSAYAASKAGILGLTRALAVEYSPRGIRVNTISPGTIDTPLLQEYFNSCPDPARARVEFLKFHPIGRFGTPRDIGRAVMFLGSEDAGFITGSELIVDGGMTSRLVTQ